MQYQTLAEAEAVTIAAYTELLLQLVQERGLQVFVHPVPPVLDEARDVVQLFESAVKEAVQQAVQSSPEVQGQLVYLDFFNHLLDKESEAVQQQLRFDGTHLHPRYLKHLEAALTAADQG